jgi:hypothetical protein
LVIEKGILLKRGRKPKNKLKNFWKNNHLKIYTIFTILSYLTFFLIILRFDRKTEVVYAHTNVFTETIIKQPIKTKTMESTATITVSPTPTSVSQVVTKAQVIIPTPQRNYFCSATQDEVCPENETDFLAAITDMIYKEGGGLSGRVAVDLLQALDNRMQIAWSCSGKPDIIDPGNGKSIVNCLSWEMINPNHNAWSAITSDEFKNLALYLVSQSYPTTDGADYPAWNTWSMPFQQKTIMHNASLRIILDGIYDAVKEWYNQLGNPKYLDGYMYTSISIYQPVQCDKNGYCFKEKIIFPDEILVELPAINYFAASYGQEDFNWKRDAILTIFIPDVKGYIYFMDVPPASH